MLSSNTIQPGWPITSAWEYESSIVYRGGPDLDMQATHGSYTCNWSKRESAAHSHRIDDRVALTRFLEGYAMKKISTYSALTQSYLFGSLMNSGKTVSAVSPRPSECKRPSECASDRWNICCIDVECFFVDNVNDGRDHVRAIFADSLQEWLQPTSQALTVTAVKNRIFSTWIHCTPNICFRKQIQTCQERW